MPRTKVTVTEAPRSAAPVQPAQQVGDNANNMFLEWNDGRIILELNASGGACEFEFLIPTPVDGQTVPALKVAVAEGVTKLLGGLPPGIYNQADGTVSVNITTNKGKLRAYHF